MRMRNVFLVAGLFKHYLSTLVHHNKDSKLHMRIYDNDSKYNFLFIVVILIEYDNFTIKNKIN